MRNAFADQLVQIAQHDSRTVLLSGDIGNRLFDSFRQKFSDRFFNCGIAEANMMGVAAGMAACGLRPVVYTIVPFVTTRCLEQIRVDVCYHQHPVVIVGVGGGLCYAGLGATHHSCEDIALLRVIPHMTVVCPGDSWEVRQALQAAINHDGPVYLRLGKKGEPDVHSKAPPFSIGQAIRLRDGSDVTLIATGNMLPTAVAAAELLNQAGIASGVISMHTVKPLDEEALEQAFFTSRVVATIEEHSILGGLGGAVAEWIADRHQTASRLLRIGTTDSFLHQAADQSQARRHFELEAPSIVRRVTQLYKTVCKTRTSE